MVQGGVHEQTEEGSKGPRTEMRQEKEAVPDILAGIVLLGEQKQHAGDNTEVS